MKKIIFVSIVLFVARATIFCQPLKIKWSAEFDQKKGTAGIDAFFADGLFYQAGNQ